jgi:AcrR family transcriptional regulator
MPKAAPPYHHGDLRQALLREARQLLREGGVEELSLRKIAERIGVSAASLYHHFKDKNDLLCALAEEGFRDLERAIEGTVASGPRDLARAFRAFVRAYVAFAMETPERYDLMFGRAIWKAGTPTESLRTIAYAVFRGYVDRVDAVVRALGAERGVDALRLAEASWAMLHGLCRLRIDGIYVDQGSVDAMSDEAARIVLARVSTAAAPAKKSGGRRA